MVERRTGGKIVGDGIKYPNVNDGVAGVKFVDSCLASHAADGQWMPL